MRKKMGWTQKKLANNVRLSQQTISFIENGNFNFSFSSLLKITHALNLNISLESKTKYADSADTGTPYSMVFKSTSTKID